MLRMAAATGWNRSTNRSWKLEASTATTSQGPATASDSASPTLPAATDRIPEASSIAAVASVTVVFPLVPVTATYGTARWEAANSSSLTNGSPAARVSTIGPADSGMPGLVTTRSTASRRRRSQSPPWVATPAGRTSGPEDHAPGSRSYSTT